jgi:anionic cell wall polymer biosynthesis LytR-Cps2A-Psr (LCP) family protein
VVKTGEFSDNNNNYDNFNNSYTYIMNSELDEIDEQFREELQQSLNDEIDKQFREELQQSLNDEIDRNVFEYNKYFTC